MPIFWRGSAAVRSTQYPVRFWATLREVTEESGVEFDDVLPAHDVFAKVAGAEWVRRLRTEEDVVVRY